MKNSLSFFKVGNYFKRNVLKGSGIICRVGVQIFFFFLWCLAVKGRGGDIQREFEDNGEGL